MKTARLEAFSDGVFAIIITIMVLEIKTPSGNSFYNLLELLPTLVSYILSFIFIGIYWVNHHHLFQAIKTVSTKILWSNLNLLFWLSLVPVATEWLGHSNFAVASVVTYGVLLLICGGSATIQIQSLHASDHEIIDLKAILDKSLIKVYISITSYLLGITLAFYDTRITIAIYFLAMLIWVIPNREIERKMRNK
ncbi:MAG: TMEM175 family protein [Methylacidiphilales bacterium]|nr:TMEM175 family protein [Candidatus Methylacidiphilales bacterium]